MSGERIPMSDRDMRRAHLLEKVVRGERSLQSITTALDVSYRQAKRLYRRYRDEGAAGLVHRTVGRRSQRRIDEAHRARVIDTYREQYADFGPTFAAEKLQARDGLAVDHETLRRWLIDEGLWVVRRRRRTYRSRRERRHRFGELVQFDGSHHRWFEDRRQQCCLMNMVDDATGITHAFLIEQETTAAAMRLLWSWIERYGIPQAVYCDRKNAFVLDRKPTVEEQLRGLRPMSHFQRACGKLGIEVIVARSPQAKGRVERNHAVYQDRLVKELRLAQINDIQGANEFLTDRFLDELNTKFAKPPIDGTDAHAPLLRGQSLANILCFTASRVVAHDYVVLFEHRLFQIQRHRRHPLVRPGAAIWVHHWLDGSLHFFSPENQELLVEEIPQRPKPNQEDALSA